MRKERIKHMGRHQINIKHKNKKMMHGKTRGKKRTCEKTCWDLLRSYWVWDQNRTFATEGMCLMNDRDQFKCNQTQNTAASGARARRETSLRAAGEGRRFTRALAWLPRPGRDGLTTKSKC